MFKIYCLSLRIHDDKFIHVIAILAFNKFAKEFD